MYSDEVVYDDEFYLKYGDPRMQKWLLMSSPVYTVIIVLIYLLFVLKIGPEWMKHKKPYTFKFIMFIYNMGLVALSAWMTFAVICHGWFKNYNWRCEPIDFSQNPDAVKISQVSWFYYISKLIELADTVFFVLRKKDAQITGLHLLHHSLTPVSAWYGIKFGPGGYNTMLPMVNSFVHVWMYLYYALAALGPSVQQYLWWKKYLTTLQLVQFIIVFSYNLQLYLFPVESCKVNQFLIWMALSQAVMYFGLFLRFYFLSYRKKTTLQSTVKLKM